MIRITCDFETANLAGVDLKVVGAEVYAAHWATEILCLSTDYLYLPIFVPGVDHPGALTALADNEDVLFDAHGAGFEQAIWRHIMVKQFDFPEIPIERWACTMATAANRHLDLALEKCAKALDLTNQKDMKGNALTKKLSEPNKAGYFDRSPETLEKVYAYCRQDVAVEAELRSRLGDLSDYERPIWELDQHINARGVRLDLAFIRECLSVVDQATKPLTAEFRAITGGLAPGQVGKFKEWLAAEGVELYNLRKETLAALLGEDDGDLELDEGSSLFTDMSLPPLPRRALRIRSRLGSASIKKLKRMLACVSADGRSRGLLQYHGTGPGRKAGRLWQPQNLPWDKTGRWGTLKAVEAIRSGEVMWDDNPIAIVGFALRGAMVADPGKLFFVGDFAGIQARIGLALAGQHDKTELMASGQDVYLDFAHAMYRKPPGTFNKDANPDMRQKGKGGVLGCGFQCGYDRFNVQFLGGKPGGIVIMDREPVIQPWAEGDAETAILTVDTYRREWAPLVVQFWREIESAALAAVQQPGSIQRCGQFIEYQVVDWWLECRMISGATMYYFDPQLGVGRFGNPAWSYLKSGWDIGDKPMAHRVDAYGGMLTENVVMAFERALMVEAQFRLEAGGFPVVLDGHDEIVCETSSEILSVEDQLEAFKWQMEQSPEWAAKIGIPIAVDAWYGDRYRK